MTSSIRCALFVLTAPLTLAAQSDPARTLQREILKQLVEINTSDSAGHTRDAAEAMQKRLIAAGLPSADVQVLGYEPKYQNLVARYRGKNPTLKPILLDNQPPREAALSRSECRNPEWPLPFCARRPVPFRTQR